MTETILRGRVLRFLREPEGIDDAASYAYAEDGAILIRDGRVAAVGDAAAILRDAPAAQVIDHRPHLLMPGFIDTHIHMPQAQIIGSWGAQLLDWLNTYTFPAEVEILRPRPRRRASPAPSSTCSSPTAPPPPSPTAPRTRPRSTPTSPRPRPAASACSAAR